MRKTTFISLAIMLFLSTAAHSQSELEKIEAGIIGTWVWGKTEVVDRGGGGSYSSEDVDLQMKLVFHENGLLEVFRNDSLINTSAYSLEEIRYLDDPIRYYLNSELIHDEIKWQENSFRVGPFGGCGAIRHYRRVEEE